MRSPGSFDRRIRVKLSTKSYKFAFIAALSVWIGSTGSPVGAQALSIATVGLTAGWATFGEAVPQGQATTGLQIGTLATQTDVKNRWPDGSIKYAIVSANVPSAGNYVVTSSSLQTGTFTPVVPSASVSLNIGGTTYTATLPASPGSDAWMAGPLVQEWRNVVAPLAGGTPHPFLRVIFDTRVFSDAKAHLSVTVENVLNQTGATTTTYDVTIVANGQTKFTHTGVQHYYLTRWRKAYDLNFTPSTVTPDLTPFNVSKAIPAFNSVVNLDTRVDTIGSNFDILQSGAVDKIMGAHGGRAELGPVPDWTARYLVKKNVTQGQFVLVNADLAGSWPIHVREPETSSLSGLGSEHLMSVDQEPNVWLYSGGTGIKGSPMPMAEYGSGVPGPGQSPLGPSNAHVPDLVFVPYLLTGDRYYAEEMAFWANHGMLSTNGHGAQGLLTGNEVRGVGWVLRNMAEAAAYYPDSSPVKAYLAQKVVNNLNWLNSFANSLKTPSNPLWIVYAWTPYDRPEGPEYFTHWENNYLAYGIDRAVKLGFAADNAYRDAVNDLQLRFFTSDPDYPRTEGAPYAIPYGTRSGSTVTFFTTMAQFKPGAVANHRDFAGYYGPEARLSIMEARERGGAGAQAAYDYLWPFIGAGTSYCSTNGTTNEPFLACRAGFALDPYPSSATPPPAPGTAPTATLTAAPASVTAGQSASLTWTTTNATTVSINQGIGTVAASGTRTVSPSATTTYTLTATNPAGSTAAAATVTVTSCTYTLSATTAAVGSAASSGSVSVTAGSACSWTATSNAAWITITAGASGTAAGTVSLSVAANTGSASRTGTATIAGQTFTVTQSGACTYALSATTAAVGASASSGTVSVTAGNTCTWTATSNAAWITITSGASGTGNGTAAYSVAANTGSAARTGTMTIAGLTFTVTQAAGTCTYTLSATSAALGPAAISGTVSVTASASTCAWTATSNVAWITITAGASGTGSGAVSISVAANTGTGSRTGTLTIAGVTYTVVQSASAPCISAIAPLSQAIGIAGGTVTLNVTAPSGCAWTATTTAAWISVTSGATGAGNGSVTLQIVANTGTASRVGTVTVAGQAVTLSQAGTTALSNNVVDFNGDGVADSFSYDPVTGNFVETITGQGSISGVAPTGLAIQLTDLDGDGLTDIFGYNATNGSWVKAVNTGRGDFTTSSGTWWPGSQAYALDLDGRGQFGIFFDTGAGLLMPLMTGAASAPTTRPWLSADRLRLYYGSIRASGGSRLDLFVATRTSVTADFGTPTAITELNVLSASSSDPSFTSDELTVFFATDRVGGSGGFDIWMATRTSRTSAFSAPQPLTGLNSAYRDTHPAIAPNGLTLYFESDRPGGLGGSDIWVATRESASAPFGPPVAFSVINSAYADSFPVVTADTRELYFSSDRPGGSGTGNMWRARLFCDSVVGGSSSFAASGGSGVVTITDASGCAWVATSTQPWITFSSGFSGSGNAAIGYVVAANTGVARTATITVGGQNVVVTQSAASSSGPSPTPSPTPGPTPSPTPGPTPSPSPGPTPSPVPPTAPLNLRSTVTGSTVVLNWDAPTSGTPATYIIDAGSYPGGSNILANYATGNALTSYTATAVSPGTYTVRVRAANAAGTGPASNEIVVAVSAPCDGPPAPPRNLTYAVAGSTVTLTWDPPSPTSFISSYGIVGTLDTTALDVANADTGSSFTRFTATGVPSGTYRVRVVSKNACGTSGFSSKITVVVP